MPLSVADREAAKKRRLEKKAEQVLPAGPHSLHQRVESTLGGGNANAGTQRADSIVSLGATLAPEGGGSPHIAKTLAIEPTFLLDHVQVEQVFF